MRRPLSADAEKIRGEIKEMIRETATEKQTYSKKVDRLRSDDGRIMYAGDALSKKVVELRDLLSIGTEFGWTVWHFPTAEDLINENNSMYLVPLSSDSTITPGGPLTEGYLIHITDKQTLSSCATIIIYMR
ncbi:hypothetical protein BDV32DRAFT_69 [Aspergillus pseudonomiae]|uniref:Uncharacterized protein n=1 Tax=Aspergillus pseudonomiae TaxID=1506151 RepID=A0A5N6III1_9EURO|nr:uncharacterized protein BDV37DRAFT_201582 [Aspergillus pseudonomiae]KAB8265977.1 hypothetical protein BDV32DRAFT_69 [Aspergillus pseudonomiae]KAE8400563.1 hypothetical protein BDV37DRAFT_201582 [Aspergillus pseudonomiae]